MEKEQPTKEEIEAIRNTQREIALKNIKDEGLLNLATAYIVEESGQFGEAGKSAIEQFKYLPAFENGVKYVDHKTGEEVNLAQQAMIESRQGGKRYTGNVNEFKLIEKGSQIVQEALNNLKVQDMLDLMGSEKKVKKELENDYVGYLNPKISKEDYNKLSGAQKEILKEKKEIYKNLVGGYQTYLAQTKVAEALGQSAKQIPKGLESILCESEKKDNVRELNPQYAMAA